MHTCACECMHVHVHLCVYDFIDLNVIMAARSEDNGFQTDIHDIYETYSILDI